MGRGRMDDEDRPYKGGWVGWPRSAKGGRKEALIRSGDFSLGTLR